MGDNEKKRIVTYPGLELRSVSKKYGEVLVLTDVSFSVGEEEHTAILGRSGHGKSTALRILAGLEGPNTGAVLLNGKVVSDGRRIFMPPHKRGISVVFQDLALWPNLSVMENVLLVRKSPILAE